MNRCDFRIHRECGCEPGACVVRVPSEPPVSRPSIGLTLSASIVIGAIAAFFVFVSMPRAMEADHRQQIERQEASIQWK